MFGIENFSESIIKFGAGFDVSQLGKAALFGGAVLLIGMATVFAVLCILWAFLMLFKLVFHDLPKKKAEASKATEVAQQPVQTVVYDTNEELVAVIAAAIAAAESDNTGIKFKVVSFRKV